MGIFSRLFGKREKTVPESAARDTGVIRIKGDAIICEGSNSLWDCKVEIEGLQYAYVVVNEDLESRLFLFNGTQNTLPVAFKGFEEVYRFLSDKYGFNDKLFFDHVHKRKVQRLEIWRKKNPKNYDILKAGDHKDYALGYEIQAPDKEFISWDTAYEVLEKNTNIFFEKSIYGQKSGRFKYPVRIGNILLYDLDILPDQPRADVPALRFYLECFSGDNSDRSYHDLKKRLIRDSEKSELGYERSDQNYYSFDVQQMQFSLSYTYDSEWQYNGGYTSFSIENNRDYPHLLENRADEEEMNIDQVILLDATIKTSGNYKKNAHIKRRPPKLDITYSGQTVIWIDELHGKIGFADEVYAQVFALEKLKSFSIENMLPAKGGGMGYLNILFHKKGDDTAVLSGDCHAFDQIAVRLAEISGKAVIFEQEYYNC